MAEQTFRSPGFFDREVDLGMPGAAPLGTPAGIVGASLRGPAFVPTSVGSFDDFKEKFGGLDPALFGPYAVKAFLDSRGSRKAVTYVKILGAGANNSTADIETTVSQGTVKNAGFVISGSYIYASNVNTADVTDPLFGVPGTVKFLAATHFVSASQELYGFPIFSDNDSFVGTSTGDDHVHLIRAAIFTSTGSRISVTDYDSYIPGLAQRKSTCMVAPMEEIGMPPGTFKLMISSSAGANFGATDGTTGLKVYTASLDPSSQYYINNVLNTNPKKFQTEEHLLYLSFGVDNEVAPVSVTGDAVGILSGTHNQSSNSPVNFQELFGRYDTRYTTPRTTSFISQPYGAREFDLFSFETLDDGAYANDKFKISIANLKASNVISDPYPTFDVQVRKFDDTDKATKILERYVGLNLDPESDKYICRVIGDHKVVYKFDAPLVSERRLVIAGRFSNKSRYVRIVPSADLAAKRLPKDAMPFGFRGIPVIKTSDSLTDRVSQALRDPFSGRAIGDAGAHGDSTSRIGATTGALGTVIVGGLSGSIVPPLPYRFKVTKGQIDNTKSNAFVGWAGELERTDSQLYWGVQTTRMARSGSLGTGLTVESVLKPNQGELFNGIVTAYTKFQGITKMDALVTGSGADLFNNNKFSLARVCLGNTLDANSHITDVSSSAKVHMRETAYIRNGVSRDSLGTIRDPVDDGKRITLATLLLSSSVVFNRFTNYTKFTNIFHGGFDGLNILDQDQAVANDKATSTESGGLARTVGDITGPGQGKNQGLSKDVAGSMEYNSLIASYKVAADMLTSQYVSNINILAIPGIREPLITNRALDDCKDYGRAFYVMDIQQYDADGVRVYDSVAGSVSAVGGTPTQPAVQQTAEKFEVRRVDNNYAGVYFPDVLINDPDNRRTVKVPSSVAGLTALAKTDNVRSPWYAPAGFARGALSNVTNVDLRLTAGNRDELYDARINPIATFSDGTIVAPPSGRFVVFGQKTLQIKQSALDRINVRRMLLEVKRQIVDIARGILFEQNTPATRAKFITAATLKLALVQAGAGIEQFQVVMDDSNNSQTDVLANRLKGRIVVVPTRAIEFIAIDFVIDQTGVNFG